MVNRSIFKMTVAFACLVLSTPSVAARPGVRTSTNPLLVQGYKKRSSRRSLIKVAPTAIGNTTANTEAHLATAAAIKIRAKREKNLKRREVFLVFGLGALAGVSDVISSRFYGYYSNMMTGNFIRCAVAFAEGNLRSIIFFTCLISAYAVGVALFRLFGNVQDAPTKKHKHIRSAASLAQVSLVTFVAADLLFEFVSSLREGMVSKQWRLPFLAIGFGLVNAASMNAAPGQVTNACTGHLTRITVWLVEIFDTYSQQKVEAVQYPREYGTDDTAGVTTTLLTPTSTSPKKASQSSSLHQVSMSFSFLISFVGAVVVSVYLCNQIGSSSASMEMWVAKLVQILASAPGACFGVLYYALFCWYYGR